MISSQKHTSDTTELVETKHHKFHVKDPGSALTHFIAMIGALIAAVPLLHKAAGEADSRHLAALAVFIVSMILLYAASTTYHTFNISEHVNKILLIYTAGGIIYALKLPIFNATHKNFGSHEIFHLFVMGGSLCHYVMMYAFVA